MAINKDYKKLLLCVAENIRRLRHKAGLTQEDMMDKGFNYRHYQKLEGGSYSPNLQTLHRLAVTFNVDIRELFFETKSKEFLLMPRYRIIFVWDIP